LMIDGISKINETYNFCYQFLDIRKRIHDYIVTNIIKFIENTNIKIMDKYLIKIFRKCKFDYRLVECIINKKLINITETLILDYITNINVKTFLERDEKRLLFLFIKDFKIYDGKDSNELNHYILTSNSIDFIKKYMNDNNIIPDVTSLRTALFKKYDNEMMNLLINDYKIKADKYCFFYVFEKIHNAIERYDFKNEEKQLIDIMTSWGIIGIDDYVIDEHNNSKYKNVTIELFRYMFMLDDKITVGKIKNILNDNNVEIDIYCLRYACRKNNDEVINYILANYDIQPDKECFTNILYNGRVSKATFKKLIRAYYRN